MTGLRVNKGSHQGLIVLWLYVPLVFVGCADNPPAPIETRVGAEVARDGQSAQAPRPGEVYVVRPGDTLYSIAFRYGINVNELAARNQIKAPYTIYPGQKVVTDLSDFSYTPVASQSKASDTRSVASTSSPATGSNQASSTDKREETAKPKPISKPKSTTSPSTDVAASSVPRTAHTGTFGPVAQWRWPSSGRVARSYSDVRHKGIDIAGSRGDLIRASAAGEVVYAGTGLKGYGLLLIVKHNEQFLSAYGHNDLTLVEEGAWVKEGQVIAKMGSSGTDSVKLHFEIRREGQPIDPVRLLPRR